MKKLFILCILSILAFLILPLAPLNAANATSLTIHYKRYDASYDDWDMWLWAPGKDGSDYAFTTTDSYGAVANINLTGDLADISQIGVIVKKEIGGNWVKDVSDDRYIDLTKPDQSGRVHAYLLESESFISYVLEDSPLCSRDGLPNPYYCGQDLSPRIVRSYFNSSFNIVFQLSQSILQSQLTILKDGVSIPYTGFSSGTSGTITLTEAVDTESIYELDITSESFTDKSIITFGADYDSSLFAEAYHFDGWLGHSYEETQTTFRLWAPLSSEVSINLYTKGHNKIKRADGVDDPYQVIPMDYIGHGVWEIIIPSDLHEVYYTFNIVNDGTLIKDIADPYGKSFGINGLRSMVVDFDRVNPEGWDSDQGVKGYDTFNDWIIYELHVRDLTTHSSWNGPASYRGKYMGLTVKGTTYTNPTTNVTVSTGLDHLVELGITHLHLLPTYDQDSYNDEANFQFNWGYNPEHFNSPEGGYSTDPYNGSVRVNEFKQMVQALHSNGINVILDKVYNHTGNGVNFTMNKIVPNYIYRLDSGGGFSNGTGVGNETKSERYMFRKFMIDSATYWAEEYHIDGFRFDLMAVHDKTTMNQLTDAVQNVNSEIQVYGEPWGGGTIGLAYEEQAGKNNIKNMPKIAAFNDQFRDNIKGSTFNETSPGYITNGNGVSDLKKGIVGSTSWNWGNTSSQSINYISAHDNLTLYDKLLKANGQTSYSIGLDYQARLGNSIVLLSQGVPFLHAGVDFLRTKGGNHNSYNASDSVNQLNWIRKSLYSDSFEYYKGMIELRKTYESFKMIQPSDILSNLTFLSTPQFGLVGYNLTKNNENILIYHNSANRHNEITLPSGAWKLLANQKEVDLAGLGTYAETFTIHKAETLVFIEGNLEDVIPSPTLPPAITNVLKTVYDTANLTITTSSNVTSYKINDGDFIELSEPSQSIELGQLTEGNYEVVVRNNSGDESDPVTFRVIANNVITIIPEILTQKTTYVYGDIITLETSTNVTKYKLNDGAFFNLDSPTTTFNLIGLEKGTYQIIVSNIENQESEIFIFEIIDFIEDDDKKIPVYPFIIGGSVIVIGGLVFFIIKRKRLV